MSKIDPSISRSPFFPNAKNEHLENGSKVKASELRALQRNDGERASYLKNHTSRDANVDINQGIKDFSRIKRAVDIAEPMDNSEKISRLKSQIASGTYEMDYDAIAERILESEF